MKFTWKPIRDRAHLDSINSKSQPLMVCIEGTESYVDFIMSDYGKWKYVYCDREVQDVDKYTHYFIPVPADLRFKVYEEVINELEIKLMTCKSGTGLMSYGYSFIQIGGIAGSTGDDVKKEEIWDGDFTKGDKILDCRHGKCETIHREDLRGMIKKLYKSK